MKDNISILLIIISILLTAGIYANILQGEIASCNDYYMELITDNCPAFFIDYNNTQPVKTLLNYTLTIPE